MKTNILYIAAALAAVCTAWSCSDKNAEPEVIAKGERTPVTVRAGAPQTKTEYSYNNGLTTVEWANGDQILAYYVDTGCPLDMESLSADGQYAEFSGEIYDGFDRTPSNGDLVAIIYPVGTVMGVNLAQQGGTLDDLKSSDVMFGSGTYDSASKSVVNADGNAVQLTRKVAVLHLKDLDFGSSVEGSVKSLILSGNTVGNQVMWGDASSDWDTIASITKGKITVTFSSPVELVNGKLADAYIAFFPVGTGTSDEYTIIASLSGGKNYTCSWTGKSAYEADKMYKLTATMSEAPTPTIYIGGVAKSGSSYDPTLWTAFSPATLASSSYSEASLSPSSPSASLPGFTGILDVAVDDNKNVYALESSNTPTATNATVWKNGAKLYDLGAGATASKIHVSGDNVYVVGTVVSGTDTSATIWTNGTAATLSPATSTATSASATGIVTVGSDIYVAGRETVSGIAGAVLWKNGTAYALAKKYLNGFNQTSIRHSGANDITTDGTTYIYVAGFGGNNATESKRMSLYWRLQLASDAAYKTVVATRFSTLSEAYSVGVNGSTVYGGGRRGSGLGTAMKPVAFSGSNWMYVLSNTAYEGAVTDVAVYNDPLTGDTEIHAVGWYYDTTASKYKAMYWHATASSSSDTMASSFQSSATELAADADFSIATSITLKL